jgi:PAS domain S-box-containing protein
MNKVPVNPAAPPDALVTEALEELPVAYVELNAKGVVTRANRAARALYPHEHGEITGKFLWNIMPAVEKEISRAAFFEIMESGVNLPPVRRAAYTSAGEYRTFELHRSLIRDAQGSPVGVRIVTFDVTGTQLAYEEAHQAQQWLESVMASIPEAIIVTDALGFVRNVNPAAEELLGWKTEEMIGKMIEEGLPLLSYTSADQRLLTHSIALEGRTKGIATVLDHARQELRVEISTSPVVDTESGFTTGVASVLRRVE